MIGLKYFYFVCFTNGIGLFLFKLTDKKDFIIFSCYGIISAVIIRGIIYEY